MIQAIALLFLFGGEGDKSPIPVVTEDRPSPIKIESGKLWRSDPPASERTALEPLLAKELAIYPSSLVRKLLLRKIVLSHHLQIGTHRSFAVSDLTSRILYLDIDSRVRPLLPKLLHHHLYRFLDSRDPQRAKENEAWTRSNGAGFQYSKRPLETEEDPRAFLLSRSTPGFLSAVSIAGVDQDQAEVFAHLVLDHRGTLELARSDRVLDEKVKRIKAQVKRLCPELDEAFWERIKPRAPKEIAGEEKKAKKADSPARTGSDEGTSSAGGAAPGPRGTNSGGGSSVFGTGQGFQEGTREAEAGPRLAGEVPTGTVIVDRQGPVEKPSDTQFEPPSKDPAEPGTNTEPGSASSAAKPWWWPFDLPADWSEGMTGGMAFLAGKALRDASQVLATGDPAAIAQWMDLLKTPAYWLSMVALYVSKRLIPDAYSGWYFTGPEGANDKIQRILESVK